MLLVHGRVGYHSLEELLGVDWLLILMPTCKLAKLVMDSALCEDHCRNPLDTVACSQEVYWIVHGRRLTA